MVWYSAPRRWNWKRVFGVYWTRHKNRTGKITHLRAFRPKQYSTTDDHLNCSVVAYKAFRDHRPPSTMTPISFLLYCYQSQASPMLFQLIQKSTSRRTYSSIMRDMAERANLHVTKKRIIQDKKQNAPNSSCWHCPYYNSTDIYMSSFVLPAMFKSASKFHDFHNFVVRDLTQLIISLINISTKMMMMNNNYDWKPQKYRKRVRVIYSDDSE